MAPTVLVIDKVPKNLETCQPNLMPFNVSFNGLAAISTFMNVKLVERTEAQLQSTEVSGSQTEASSPKSMPTGATIDPEAVKDESGDVSMSLADSEVVLEQKNETSESAPASQSKPSGERFISSFRGRTIQGLTVSLPDGYGGLVLRSSGPQPTASNASEGSKPKLQKKESAGRLKPRGRLTRSAASSKRVVDVDEPEVETLVDDGEDDIDAMTVDEAHHSAVEGPAIKKNLVPSAQFSSFVLWRPDNPVVEMQDDYLRSIQEWTTLAAEIHRSEDILV